MLGGGSKDEQACWRCVLCLTNANGADSAPAATRAAGAPHQHVRRHSAPQWRRGSLSSRTKSSQDTVTSLESRDEGLLIGASTAWTELSLGTFGGREGKHERENHGLMYGRETGSDWRRENQIDSPLENFEVRLRAGYHKAAAGLRGAN